MVLFYVCNGFFHQIRLGSYQLALPVPGILKLCNYLQNVVAITYIFALQLSTFLFYNKQIGPFCDKAPSLPLSMQEQETESSRMLAALEKKHVQSRQQRADAISFGEYRKDGGRHV